MVTVRKRSTEVSYTSHLNLWFCLHNPIIVPVSDIMIGRASRMHYGRYIDTRSSLCKTLTFLTGGKFVVANQKVTGRRKHIAFVFKNEAELEQ